MRLSQDLIQRFQKLYLAKFGAQLSDEAAEFELRELAKLVRIVCHKKEEVKNE